MPPCPWCGSQPAEDDDTGQLCCPTCAPREAMIYEANAEHSLDHEGTICPFRPSRMVSTAPWDDPPEDGWCYLCSPAAVRRQRTVERAYALGLLLRRPWWAVFDRHDQGQSKPTKHEAA
jgi:hypothetical protein